jgi:hypothetical protein
MLTAADPAAAYTFVYDTRGRAKQTTHDLESLTQNVVFTQTFDAQSNRKELRKSKVSGTQNM